MKLQHNCFTGFYRVVSIYGKQKSVRMCEFQGVKILAFRKILRTYLMNDPPQKFIHDRLRSWLIIKFCGNLLRSKSKKKSVDNLILLQALRDLQNLLLN